MEIRLLYTMIVKMNTQLLSLPPTLQYRHEPSHGSTPLEIVPTEPDHLNPAREHVDVWARQTFSFFFRSKLKVARCCCSGFLHCTRQCKVRRYEQVGWENQAETPQMIVLLNFLPFYLFRIKKSVAGWTLDFYLSYSATAMGDIIKDGIVNCPIGEHQQCQPGWEMPTAILHGLGQGSQAGLEANVKIEMVLQLQ